MFNSLELLITFLLIPFLEFVVGGILVAWGVRCLIIGSGIDFALRLSWRLLGLVMTILGLLLWGVLLLQLAGIVHTPR